MRSNLRHNHLQPSLDEALPVAFMRDPMGYARAVGAKRFAVVRRDPPPPAPEPEPQKEVALAIAAIDSSVNKIVFLREVNVELERPWHPLDCRRYTQPLLIPSKQDIERLTDNVVPAMTIVRIREIQIAVAQAFGVSVRDMLSARRNKTVVIPRHVGIWLARKLTLKSYPEIGRYFGGRDHTTAMFAVEKIERMLRTNELRLPDELQRLVGPEIAETCR